MFKRTFKKTSLLKPTSSIIHHRYNNNILIYRYFCSLQEKQEFSNKIEQLVDDISNLNLKEIAEFTTLLKQKLNLPDASMMMGGPMMIQGQQQSTEEEEQVPQGLF